MRAAALLAVLLATQSSVAVPSPGRRDVLDAEDVIMSSDADFMFSSPEVQRVRAAMDAKLSRRSSSKPEVLNADFLFSSPDVQRARAGIDPGLSHRSSSKAEVLSRVADNKLSCFASTANGTASPVSFVRYVPGIWISTAFHDLNEDSRVDPWEEKVHGRISKLLDNSSVISTVDLHRVITESAKDTPECKQWLESGSVRNLLSHKYVHNHWDKSPGSTDYVLDHVDGFPGQESMHPATADEDAHELFKQLISRRRMDTIPLDKVSIISKAPEYGAGSLLHMLIYPLLQAFIDGRVLFAPQLRLWAPKDCEASDLTCYFSSLPSLNEYYVDAAAKVLRRKKTSRVLHMEQLDWHHELDENWLQKKEAHIVTPVEKMLRQLCNSTNKDDPYEYFTTDHCGVQLLNLDVKVLMRFEEVAVFNRMDDRFTRHGRFWLISQMLHFLTRPNNGLKKQLDDHRTALRLRPPYLSLHIRKGDACTARGDCRDLKYYMPHIQSLRAKYSLNSVFLSTPSQSVLDEIKNYPDLHFVHMPVSNATEVMKQHHIDQLEEGLGQGYIDAGDELRHYMVDMYMLSEGSAFLGGFTSNAARLAYSLMSAGTEGCLKPYESTDINWCFAFGKLGSSVIRHNSIACSSDPRCHKFGYDGYGC